MHVWTLVSGSPNARRAKVLLLLDRHGTVLKRIALQEHVRALAAQHVSVACISVALTSSWDALLVGLAHGEVRLCVRRFPLPDLPHWNTATACAADASASTRLPARPPARPP